MTSGGMNSPQQPASRSIWLGNRHASARGPLSVRIPDGWTALLRPLGLEETPDDAKVIQPPADSS